MGEEVGGRRWEVGGRRWEVGGGKCWFYNDFSKVLVENVCFTMVLGRFGWKMMILQWF